MALKREKIMRILCLGAGALGGYFGGRLIEAGADVTFLVREARQKSLHAKGLRIESCYGDFSSSVKTITSAIGCQPYDVILLSCKAYDLDSAMQAIAPAVGTQTMVLPFLNGLSHLDRLNERFGAAHILGGVAKIAATLTEDGVIKHLNDWRFLIFGEQDGSLSPRVLALKALLDKTSVLATASSQIMRVMWEKLVHLSTIAGMTCCMRASVGEIARTGEGTAVMLAFLQTNARIAACEGYQPSDAFMAEYQAILSDPQSSYTASMLRDIERQGPIEGDHIIGFMLKKALHHGLDASLYQLILVHLQAYEQRRAAGRL
jgi:2-dehydropantoate 2-reductase